jgi:mxaJ protein
MTVVLAVACAVGASRLGAQPAVQGDVPVQPGVTQEPAAPAPTLVVMPDPQPKPAGRKILRVAADPNNLPSSNEKREGFENKIAEIVAADLGMELEYVWRAQRRGFFRETLKEGRADAAMGVIAHTERALPTRPIYRSTYVFVTRKDRALDVASLDDPRLRALKVGVQMVGDDATNTPPAHALTRRGIINNIVGYTLYGDYREQNPPARIIDAVAKGDVDIAAVWGPLAGYFADKSAVGLSLSPVTPKVDPPGLPMEYDICAAVRLGNFELRDQIQAALDRHKDEIKVILTAYHVPLVERDPAAPPDMLDTDDAPAATAGKGGGKQP